MKKDKTKYSQVYLVLILVGATIVRFSKMFWQRDFWYDESFTGIITRMSWQDMRRMIFYDVHPPLYYYLLKPWASLFNYSVFGFRSFSAIFGILSIISIYWVGKKIFNEKIGLLSAFLMTISPFAILYSQEARMYSLFGFIIIWMFYFFVKALQTNRWFYWLMWSISSVLFLYTHYLSLFTFIVFYLAALVYKILWKRKNVNSKKGLKFCKIFFQNIFIDKKFIGAVIVIGIFFLVWLPVFKQHISRKGLGWVPIVYIDEIPTTLQFFFYGHQPGKTSEPIPNEFRNVKFSISQERAGNLFNGTSLGLIFLGILFLGIVQLWWKNKYRQEIFILSSLTFGVLLFLILLSQVGLRFYVARYFIAIAFLIYLLLAVIIEQWKR